MVRLQLYDLRQEIEHGLGDDLENLADVGHQLAGVVLGHADKIGAVGLVDADQG